ncbi:MAG: alpha/beta hydrolase [Anaerolineae bacterium]|nr:alpha/beta hydrolase [Anaerolineae bacterium]
MTPSTTGYINIGDANLYYEIAGEGSTIVLGHAGFVDSRMWDAQWSLLASHYRVVRFDHRGYGRSDRAHAPVSRRHDLARFLDALHIDQAALIGCSLSAEAMLDFALEHPSRVSALALISAVPSGFELQGEPPPHLFEMIGALQSNDLEQASEYQLRLWLDGMFRQPHQVDSALRQRVAEMNRIAVANGTWLIADSQPVDPLTPPALDRLAQLTTPTLIVTGQLDHPELLRAADVMAARIPHAQKHIIPAAAHLPSMEQPAIFNPVLLNFLNTAI